MKNKISNKDMVKVLLQPYLDRDDIGLLLGCAKTKSSHVLVTIQEELTKKGIKTLRGQISSESFLKYMQWDLNDIIEKAKIEQSLCIG